MSVWLTPDLKPFVGGTYFPPEDGIYQVGFRTVLLRILDQVWIQDCVVCWCSCWNNTMESKLNSHSYFPLKEKLKILLWKFTN